MQSLPSTAWLATLIAFYISVSSDTYYTFYPLYAISIGISLATIGVIKSAHSTVATGVRFAAAGALHVFRLEPLNHTLVIVMAVGMAALSVATDERVALAVFVVLGGSRALLRVSSVTMIAELKQRPGLNLGLTSAVYNAGYDLGNMLAPPVAGGIASQIGIPATLQLLAVVLPGLYYVVWFSTHGCRERVADSESEAQA
jgi:hypothetical protein